MTKLNFSKRALEALPLPTGKQRYYAYDIVVRGLALALSAGGRKSFILYRKIQGRAERITIGPFPDLTVAQARGRAHELNSRIALGENPAEEKRAVGQRATLGDIFEQYLERHLKVHTRRWRGAENIFRLYLSHWREKAAADIRPSEVAALHARIGKEHGNYAANRAIEGLRAAFNKAMRWGYEGLNPVRGVVKFKEQARERFLQPDEVPRFFEALNEEKNITVRDFILISLLTGARSGNIKAMRWIELDLPGALWQIFETKSGMPQNVALVPTVVAILEKREKTAGSSEWVFPARRGKTGHLVEPKDCWKALLARANIQDLRLHDLRRTLGSWLARTGASLVIIGKTLGHESLGATAIYARLDLEPVRAAVGKATQALLKAAAPAGLSADEKKLT